MDEAYEVVVAVYHSAKPEAEEAVVAVDVHHLAAAGYAGNGLGEEGKAQGAAHVRSKCAVEEHKAGRGGAVSMALACSARGR